MSRTLSPTKQKTGRKPKPPSERDLDIYERAVFYQHKHADIARDYGLTIGRISQICSKVGSWQSHSPQAMRIELDCQYKALAKLALDEFIRSREPALEEKETTGETDRGEVNKHERTTKHRVGDPRFLGEYRQTVQARAALWGVEAPQEVRHTNHDGTGDPTVRIEQVASLSDDTLQRFVDLARQLDQLTIEATAERLPAPDESYESSPPGPEIELDT